MELYCPACKSFKGMAEFSPSNQKSGMSGGRRCRTCANAAAKTWRGKNLDRHKANVKRYNQQNPHVAKKSRLKYANKPEAKEKNREWALNNPDKRREIAKRYADRARERLSDAYVAYTLEMKVSEVPRDLIEAKRVVLQIKRLVKEKA